MKTATQHSSLRAKIQTFGGFLTNMVLPNIGAFIAWGLVTAMFIKSGWFPNKNLNELVNPTIKYLLPLLLAYTGGRMVGGHRGGVLGAIGTMGLIVGSQVTQFLGAMIIGPLGGWIMKQIDHFFENRIRAGFEMIVNSFSIGIIGFIYLIINYQFIGPIIEVANNLVKAGVEGLVHTGMLPLVALINEPAKVLFLNNVIDQGIYYPLGMQQTLKLGHSLYFMLASNPGPGLGLLLAFSLFGHQAAKRTAPGAMIIHFFGGIHEMYFPYVLMKPITIIAMIFGAMSGIITGQILGGGLVAGPSPGSILAYIALTPKGHFLANTADVLVATTVTFLIAALLLKRDKTPVDDDQLEKSQQQLEQMKNSPQSTTTTSESATTTPVSVTQIEQFHKVSFACDAGMGSSAMGATSFRKRLAKLGVSNVSVKYYRIEDVPADSDVVVVHQDLAERTRRAHPQLPIISLNNYLQDPQLEQLANLIAAKNK